MEAIFLLNPMPVGNPPSLRIAGLGARSAEVSRPFKLPSGGGSHAAGMRSLGKDRLGLRAYGLELFPMAPSPPRGRG